MGSVNKVFLVGNLGRDAEVRYTQGGSAVANFSMATTETWKDKGGQKQERTTWHNVVLWGKAAEALQDYLTKGKQVCVEGSIQVREYETRDTHEKRKAFEIKADRVTLLGGGGGGGGQRQERHGGPEPVQPDHDEEPLTDDDIPF
jgi:single-strand DNA-binding protein